ncbi:unnamed protein product [Miscanthus lutarioriparius]|uniref:Uncharacterized protein n=1 Tax=Miscanthus lutarioriparius TaxID=422564 RepID=A0A811PVC3_9POAL|nr:unnamed protein product [Miscanthus lutarioriparius]
MSPSRSSAAAATMNAVSTARKRSPGLSMRNSPIILRYIQWLVAVAARATMAAARMPIEAAAAAAARGEQRQRQRRGGRLRRAAPQEPAQEGERRVHDVGARQHVVPDEPRCWLRLRLRLLHSATVPPRTANLALARWAVLEVAEVLGS